MQFAILIYSSEEAMRDITPAQGAEMVGAYDAYMKALREAGILLASSRLRPTASATTVRVSGGKTQVLNGPFAETREQLAGFCLIDVTDLDAALSWAARCPGASAGTIEVRPIWPRDEY
jgi:hypothetical protein